MENLAGNIEADKTIQAELYLANVPSFITKKTNTEVPYSYIGKLGKWNFSRAWSYWVVRVDKNEKGLILDDALELYNKKHPLNDSNLGQVVRVNGDASCCSPNDIAQPIDNDELDKQLLKLGYEKTYSSILDLEYINISPKEISELCNKGKLDVERYVNTYHIDSQIGLTEFVKFIKNKNLI